MKKQTQTITASSKKASKAPKKKPVSKAKPKKKLTEEKQTKDELEVQNVQLPPYEIEESESKYKVKIHKNYQVEAKSQIGKQIKNWIQMLVKKQALKQGKVYEVSQFSYYPTFQFTLAGQKPEQEKCSICQFEYETLTNEEMQKQLVSHNNSDLIMLKCSHIMHYQCLTSLIGEKEWIKCPVCSTIFGKMIGDQPNGSMTQSVNNFMHCEGYHDCGTITITYHMHAGRRGDISYPGTVRHGYLPNNPEGQEVLRLLKQAFNRKLIFTVGRSVTTGRDNQIVWNGIHHKTNLQGGSAYFGYPDPSYFDRVKLELAAKGIY